MDLLYSLALLVLSLGIGGLLGDKLRGQKRAGTLLGFLGPLGWAFVLILNDRRLRCPECRSVVHPEATRCARCGARFSPATLESAATAPPAAVERPDIPAPAEEGARGHRPIPASPDLNGPTILGPVASIVALAGALLLGLGCLLPLVRLPIVGSISLYSSGQTKEMLALLGFSLLTIVAALIRSPRVVWIPGTIVAAMVAAFGLNLRYSMAALTEESAAKAADGGLGDVLANGLIQMASKSMGLSWGAYVLLLGGLLSLVAALSAARPLCSFLSRGSAFQPGSEGLERDPVSWTGFGVVVVVIAVGLIVGATQLAAYLGERASRGQAEQAERIRVLTTKHIEAMERAARARQMMEERKAAERAAVERRIASETLLRLAQAEDEMKRANAEAVERARSEQRAEQAHRRKERDTARRSALKPWVNQHWPAFVKFTNAADAFEGDLRASDYRRVKECRTLSDSAQVLVDRGILRVDDGTIDGWLRTGFNAYRALGGACARQDRSEIHRLFALAGSSAGSVRDEVKRLGLP